MSRQIYAVCLKCLFSLMLLLLIALPALGQSTASITGIVQDTSDARIPNANVKLINTDTGTESNSKTNKDGDFAIPSVLPGHYRLQIERDGFDTTQLTGITLNVGDNKQVIIRMKVGSSKETVTVDASGLTVNTTDGSVSTVIDRQFVENMPLNGRSFQDLISLSPGIVTQSPQTSAVPGGSGDFSVNGQRAESNYYTVDGVGQNISAGYPTGEPQASSGGVVAASTALGTTQSLISVDALQEVRVATSSFSAEYGNAPGGQFSFLTRSGTNELHGSVFDYLRNNFFDANDWFNDHYGLPLAGLQQNDFGGTLGGPLSIPSIYKGRDKTFYFVSYEGLRLTQPQAATVQYVPDTYMRQQAPAVLQPILNAFPLPTPGLTDYGTSSSPSLAEFIKSYSLPSEINSGSARIDHALNSRSTVFFRFGYTPSSSVTRSLAELTTNEANATTYTLGVTTQFSDNHVNQLRLGYARSDASGATILDSFGGATPINLSDTFGVGAYENANPYFFLSVVGVSTASLTTQTPRNQGRQWNVVDTLDVSVGRHQIRAGVDYRHIKSPLYPPSPYALGYFGSVASVLGNSADEVDVQKLLNATPIFNDLAAFVQDEWRPTAGVTISYGLRWEVDPPPTEQHGHDAYTLLGNVAAPATLSLAPEGTPLWRTSYYNFAPRLGAAWQARRIPGWETVLRTGAGVFFDNANRQATQGYGTAVGFANTQVFYSNPLPVTPAELDFDVSAQPPYTNNAIYAFPTHLQLPYTLQWNVSLEQALSKLQAITFSYVGANGRRLLQNQVAFVESINSEFDLIEYYPNGVTSDYNALQVQFQRSIAHGLQALVSYTWSHSLDYGSNDSALTLTRGDSDFDVRNNLQAALTFDLPRLGSDMVRRLITSGWGLDVRAIARSAFPVTVSGNTLVDPATGGEYLGNVNLVAGEPLYLFGSEYPGRKAINAAAFSLPAAGGAGDAPRNLARGFGEWQINLAARRNFQLSDRCSLLVRAEAFNLFNHPNFGYVDPSLTDAQFGQATQMLNQSLGSMSAQYQQGGPRSMQFAMKLRF